MNTLVERFSIRTLLYTSMLVPLSAVVLLAAGQLWDSYGTYGKLQKAQFVGNLASAGGELAQALPGEAMGPPEARADARKRTDAALAAVEAAYVDAKSNGIEDPTITKNVDFIRSSRERVAKYRSIVDNPDSVSPQEVLSAGLGLQPTSAAGIDLMRRSGAMIDDIELSRFIQGYHAMLQVNDAGLIEFSTGEQFIGIGNIAPIQQMFAVHSRSLFATYTDPMFEFLPPDVTKPYADFIASDDNAFMQKFRDVLYTSTTFDKPDPAAAERWVGASAKRVGIMAQAMGTVAAQLKDLSSNRLAQSWNSVLLLAGLTGAAVLIAVLLSVACIRGVARPLRRIVARMSSLAEGDTQSVVPYEGRSDEIGEIAHALSHFRQTELDKARMRQEAEDMRINGERQRLEEQVRAEADADRRLTETTSALAEGLRRLAEGDMLCEISESFAQQFENLRHDFNTSVRQLREALGSVGNLAVQVDSGSSEISNASTDLAKRTENQAASLEQTAAALEEITANVVATTKRTSDARGVAQAARSKADHSGKVVNDAVTAMQRIEQSSQQINQIISVIDEIAFQTNLLALNAGVEAARAGEAGKGFAVVAQEVRELAQRSANAAKEIKQLIANSAAAVEEGVRLVNDTGSGLSEIELLVRDINQHMDAIATAAQEQSSGLSEVNTAVNSMDQATQQNAAMVEEMNAAGVGLATESAELRKLLARFRLSADGASLRRVATVMAAPAHASPAARTPATSRSVPVRNAGRTAVAARPASDTWEEF
jgi:methyl-accepting chemotaxis protein